MVVHGPDSAGEQPQAAPGTPEPSPAAVPGAPVAGVASVAAPAASERADRPWIASYDPGVPAEPEIPELTVDALLRQAAEQFPTRDALVFFGRRTSFAALDQAVDAFAGWLRRLGLGPGDTVSLHLPTCPAFVIAFLGTLRAGCMASPKSPLLVERELEILLGQTRPRLSVAMDVLVPRVAAARAALGDRLSPPAGLSGVISTGIQDSMPVPLRWLYPLKARREGRWHPVAHSAETPNLFRLLAELPAERVESPCSAADPAVLQCTGGTTGVPKAALLTHRNLVANTIQCAAVLPGERGQPATVLGALPYFHIYGLTVAMNFALHMGATQILLPRFDADMVLKAIDGFHPRYFPGVPAFYASLIEHPRVTRYDLRSVEACISGAAPLPGPIQERFEKLTGGRLCEGYGLTEASPVTHVNPVRGRGRPGTIGLPLPGTDARIVDLATGTDATTGEVGELWVRGPQVMEGYYQRPGETGRVLHDGWLRTGDMATMDADGYFAIVDRIKDLIIVSGANVYPREIEDALMTHPAVMDAVAIAIPDEHKGEVPKAFVVPRPGATVTEADLREHCRANLASYKRPVRIEIRPTLPRSMVGKVLRRELIAEHAAATKGTDPASNDSGESTRRDSTPGGSAPVPPATGG